MTTIAPDRECTGCGACAYICPKNCIEMHDNGIYGLQPHVNTTNCIECGKCTKVCPILNPVIKNHPIETYAARNHNIEEATSCASGGIACALYKYALKTGHYIAGAIQYSDFSVHLALENEDKFIDYFKNSKYVFSSTEQLYPKLEKLLKMNGKALVVGLPCQIAAIRNIFNNNPHLFLVDLVCHGTTPTTFLQQHLRMIENQKQQSISKIFFRDPAFHTYTFTLGLYNAKGERIYAKRTKDGDTYQYGYHRAITYRENCYNCHFTCPERTGDISLADFPGLGKLKPFPYEKKHINCVLINTVKGKHLFNELKIQNSISAYQRPTEEAIIGNQQLRHPVKKSKDRLKYEHAMLQENADFETTMLQITRNGLRREKITKMTLLPKRIIFKLTKSISFK